MVTNAIVLRKSQDFAVFALVNGGERIDHGVYDQLFPKNFFELELTGQRGDENIASAQFCGEMNRLECFHPPLR